MPYSEIIKNKTLDISIQQDVVKQRTVPEEASAQNWRVTPQLLVIFAGLRMGGNGWEMNYEDS